MLTRKYIIVLNWRKT